MTNLNVTVLQTPKTSHVGQAARAVARIATLILAPLAQAYRARRDAEHLMGLHDNLLKDIGVTRGEVESTVRAGSCRGCWDGPPRTSAAS
jgi:uncharacterized protein YjiS (DUF1127 family)